MFLAADIVVKSVMIGLAACSVLVWAVWIAKWIELLWAGRTLLRQIRELDGAASLVEAEQTLRQAGGPARQFVRAAGRELELSSNAATSSGVVLRATSVVADIEASILRSARWGMSFIATVGASAPFIGLFGTVWGIMNSFIGISKSKTTSLAVVAPGIAEALLATAIGLVAAIPAVILYNHLSRRIAGYKLLIRRSASSVLRILSRELERTETKASASSRPRAAE
jgi:biopolymer transport protein ExbB